MEVNNKLLWYQLNFVLKELSVMKAMKFVESAIRQEQNQEQSPELKVKSVNS